MTEATTAPIENAVATTTGSAMATCHEPFDNGLGELDAGDLIIPRLSITQPKTKNITAENIGKLHINVTGDYFEKMRIAPLKLSKSRSLFPEKFNYDNKPLCRSHDFKTPANDIEGREPMCHTCELKAGGKRNEYVCEYANWTTGDDGKPCSPRCSESWDILVFDLDQYMPMWFSVSRSALAPAKKIMSSINMICSAKRLHMCNMCFSVEVLNKNGEGTYIPNMHSLAQLDSDEAQTVEAICKQLAGVKVKDAPEQPAEDAYADQKNTASASTKTDEEF